MTSFSSKNEWLKTLSEQLSEDAWSDGLYLFREGKVSGLSFFENLVSAKVDQGNKSFAVHIKFHPSRRFFQWVECPCKRHRKEGGYCKHIAAVLLTLGQESPELVDAKAMLRNSPKRRASPSPQRSYTERIVGEIAGRIASAAEHVDGLKVSFLLNSKATNTIILNVDQQAKLFAKIQAGDRKRLPASFRRLENLPGELHAAYLFTIGTDGQLKASRVLALKSTLATLAKKCFHFEIDCYALSDERRLQRTIFGLNTDGDNIALGERHVRIDGAGFMAVEKLDTKWQKEPCTISFSDDEAEELIANNFSRFAAQAEVYLTSELARLDIDQKAELRDVDVVEQDGWFHLSAIYRIGARSASMGELIRERLAKQNTFVKEGNSWTRLPTIVSDFEWRLDADDRLILSPTELLRLQQELSYSGAFDDRQQILAKMLDQSSTTEPPPPSALKGSRIKLRHYQDEGYKWLWWLYKTRLHGLLADDMGLGKTHQSMALMCAVYQDNCSANKETRFLVVCPTSVIDHWLDKLREFAPNISALAYYGSKRSTLVPSIADHTAVITSYGVLLRDHAILARYEWDVLILDEIHYVKNHRSSTYKAVRQIAARLRIGLSGTPIENRSEELRNIFDILVPGYLTAPPNSRSAPIDDDRLQALVRPLQLRRTKTEVLSDLPEKVEDTRHCFLSDEQSKLYREILATRGQEIVSKLYAKDTSVTYMHVLTVLHMLKQVCNHPALFYPQGRWNSGISGKFELMREILAEALQSEQKVVIFSQYLKMIELISGYLGDIGVEHVVLTGQSKDRGQIINRFQTNPKVKVFVGSLLAGGIGIDLTTASVVIHYDRWWNASKENQATDRVHRIGQRNFVQVLKLVTRGTIEERIDALIKKKAKLISTYLAPDQNLLKKLNREELISLLEI